jgi:hypothetical protein
MGSERSDSAAGFNPADARHIHVKQHDVEGPPLYNANSLASVPSFFHNESLSSQGRADDFS